MEQHPPPLMAHGTTPPAIDGSLQGFVLNHKPWVAR